MVAGRVGGPAAVAGVSLRWTWGLVVWLLAPGMVLLVVLAALPGDHLPTAWPASPPGVDGLLLAPAHPVAGITSGDALLAVDGRPVERLLTRPQEAPVRAGDAHVYRVARQLPSGQVEPRDVRVAVREHRDWAGLLRSQQPDAALVSFGMLGLGIWLIRRRREDRSAHAFLLYGAGWASSAVVGWGMPEPLDLAARPWVVSWTDLDLAGYLVSGVALLLFALTFPRPVRWAATRSLTWLAVLPVVLCVGIATAASAGAIGVRGYASLNGLAEVLWEGCTLAALGTIGWRWFRLRRDAEARRRFQLVFLGFVTTFALILVGKWVAVPAGAPGFGLVLLVFPAALAVAISRRDLYELDAALNRALVALGTGSLLLAVYLVAAAGTAQLTGAEGALVALPAAGLVAVALAPLRARVQRVVNTRLFGTAGDTQLVLHRLGLRLEASADPEQLLAAVVDTAAEGLRLPYVALELGAGPEPLVVHERGTRPAAVELFPISVGDQVVGRLAVAPRKDARSLSPLDRQLLSDLARHSGVSARVVGLLTDLRTAQQRLLVAREEERHRIHRDLHDGLGPSLVGLTLQLEVAGELADAEAASDPGTSGALAPLLHRLHAEAARATEDVRRLVRDLRPAELDELGLPAAVAAAAARLKGPHAPAFALDTPTSLPQLDVAVEDAAYKICLEAMTNVLRHSGARHCRVRLAATGDRLELEVADDGQGRVGNGSSGTGLASMHERAAAVGGEVRLEDIVGGGTRVLAQLPLRAATAAPLPAQSSPSRVGSA